MDIQAEKLDLMQWLAGINDIHVIRQFSALKRSTEVIFAETLSQAEKAAIDRGLQSLKEGRLKSHEEVIEATRKKYTTVFK